MWCVRLPNEACGSLKGAMLALFTILKRVNAIYFVAFRAGTIAEMMLFTQYFAFTLFQIVIKISLSSLVKTLSGIGANGGCGHDAAVYHGGRSFSWLLLRLRASVALTVEFA